ncbi:MAG: hypothetical protein WBB91_08815 [Nostocoides sp.]|uniref:hypothetical protein n=1 Tax=Nostocoides sp. TaxID=1917966 RepID=UPI003C727846
MSRTTISAVAGAAMLALGGLAASPASAAPVAAVASGEAPAWTIADVSPRPYQIVGDVSKFADFGNYANVSPSGAHWCQASGRDDLMSTIAGRSWLFVQDYTTDGEGRYKNDASITVSGWSDGQAAFQRFAGDRLMCTWLDPQTRLTWSDKNPQRYWLSTAGKIDTKFRFTAAVRVGDMIVSVTAGSTDQATARAMATRMTVAVERNLRATLLVRAPGAASAY